MGVAKSHQKLAKEIYVPKKMVDSKKGKSHMWIPKANPRQNPPQPTVNRAQQIVQSKWKSLR